MDRIVKLKCDKMCFVCEAWIKISANIIDVKNEKSEGFLLTL